MLSSIFAAGGFLDPKTLIENGGYFLLFGIIFAESGLLIGFFLPGDSLLFAAGMACAGTLGDHRYGLEPVGRARWRVRRRGGR